MGTPVQWEAREMCTGEGRQQAQLVGMLTRPKASTAQLCSVMLHSSACSFDTAARSPGPEPTRQLGSRSGQRGERRLCRQEGEAGEEAPEDVGKDACKE